MNKVLVKIKKLWPDSDPEEILDLLEGLGGQRVQLAILKLSNGQRARLPELVEMAKRDWRDVLAYAEYPEEMRLPISKRKTMSPEEMDALRRRDKRQYQDWLKG